MRDGIYLTIIALLSLALVAAVALWFATIIKLIGGL